MLSTNQQILKAVQTSEQMHEMRDFAKRIMGERYPAHVAPWVEFVQQLAKGAGIEIIEVLTFLDRHEKAQGKELSENQILWLTAATVEILEPTKC